MTVADIVRADLVRTHTVPAARAAGGRVRAAGGVRRYRVVLVLGDVGIAILIATAAAMLTSTSEAALFAALPVGWVLLSLLSGGYEGDPFGAGVFELRRVLLTGTLLMAALPVLGVLGLEARVPASASRGIVAMTATVVLARGVQRRHLRRMRRRGMCVERVVVVGDPSIIEPLIRQLSRVDALGLETIAVAVPPGSTLSSDLAIPVLGDPGRPDTLIRQMQAAGANSVLLAAGGSMGTSTLRTVARAAEWAGLRLLLAPSVVDVASSAPVVPVAGAPVLRVPRPGPAGAARFVKNSIDRVGAGLGLVVLLPVLLGIALAVRLDSRGPVLFRQRRIGTAGREFTMYKFRSMRADAEALIDSLVEVNEGAGPLFKLRNDPRVTRVGRVLRKASLDELPQLINVIRGEMSLVGPRPPLPREVAEYTSGERRRLLVKPGLTGLWQVSGRSDLPWVDAVRLDLHYVSDWSISMDLRLLARTAAAVTRRTGAF